MHLMTVMTSGPEVSSWVHPWAENDYLNGDWWARMAQTMERAKFDAIFFADAQTLYGTVTPRKGGDVYLLDPIPLAASVAALTEQIGIGITVSTSFFHPYAIARSMGTLDVLSRGRIAWNVVTSAFDEEAQRHGMPSLLPKEERYDRADEVVEACLRLWKSFPAQAYVVDKNTTTFIDPFALESFEYEGRYVSTKGPISTPPSPQGHPVIMQAGSSPRGRDFAARWAEIVFTYQRTKESMQEFRSDIDRRLVAAGRQPGEAKLMPSIQAVVGETESIAREKCEYIFSLVDDEAALYRTSLATRIDLGSLDPGAKLAHIDLTGLVKGGATDVFLNAMGKDDLTVIEAARRFAINDLGPELIGTPVQVADKLEEMFTSWGADGFILSASALPTSVDDFARAVVPILQERGLFRADYEGNTLREHLNQG